MKAKQPSRRRFLKESVAFAGLAVATPGSGVTTPGSAAAAPEAAAQTPPTTFDNNSIEAVLYGRRSRFVTTVRHIEQNGDHGTGGILHADPWRPSASTPLGESVGILTPTSLHYTTQHNYGIPDINPIEHRLMIHGMVERPKVFTVDELKRYPYVSEIYFLECVGNKMRPSDRTVADSHGRTACSEWTGVPLSLLLKEAGVLNTARWIVGEGVGGGMFTISVPMLKAMDDTLIAFAMNGEPLRPDHGFPLRLLVPGFEGIHQVKWLRRIKVVDRPYVTYQESQRYLNKNTKAKDFYFEMGPKSVITYPSGEHQLTAHGHWMITGLAWSGAGAIRRVEVTTDGGQTWKDADLVGRVLKRAHTRFNFPWNWTGDEAMLMSRCTDEAGQVQPSLAQFAKFWGETPNYILNQGQGATYGHMNFMQPWKVNRLGRVSNGHASST